MNLSKLSLVAGVSTLLLAAPATSQAVVIVLSDGQAAGTGVLENFFQTSFNNVTQIRHGNFADFAAAATQDAINGTGIYAGQGPADVIIIGRTLASADYDAFASTGYNGLNIPMVSLTSYVARQDADRLGWHASGSTTDKSVVGNETTITAAGALVLGLPAGTYDFALPPSGSDSLYNGLGSGTTAYGGADILATIGGDTLAAYWAPGDAPGNPTVAGVATFPAARLLFNLDNDVNGDLGNLSAQGQQALVNAIEFATPLSAVPEPSSALMLLAGCGFLANRRRRAAAAK